MDDVCKPGIGQRTPAAIGYLALREKSVYEMAVSSHPKEEKMEEERKFSRVENERKVAFAKSAFHSRERSVDLCNCGYRIPKIYFVGREVKKNNEHRIIPRRI